MKKFFAAALACAAFFVPALAMAAEAAVTLPYGDLVAEAAHIASALITPVVLLLLGKLTGPVGLFLRTFLGETLIRNAVAYAVNAVEGAAKGKTLSIPVGSAVLAEAVQYAVDQGPKWLVNTLGGPEGIRQKVFRSLDLDENASIEKLTAAQ